MNIAVPRYACRVMAELPPIPFKDLEEREYAAMARHGRQSPLGPVDRLVLGRLGQVEVAVVLYLGDSPHWAVESTSLVPYARVPDDGRCAACEGWGCLLCGGSGGY